MHAKGLLLGVYSDRGTHDFSGAGLGMKGHETEDARWMASVGVDYLKVDDMSGIPHTQAGAYADYATIRDALNATGRPIFFSTCGHSGDNDGHAAAFPWVGPKCGELANACRIASDVRFWGPGTFGTNKAVNVMAMYGGNWSHAGSWPDPDLIYSYKPVGPTGTNSVCKGAGVLEYCTGSFCDPVQTHAVTQFALWAVMGAPLLLSFDVRSLTPTEISRVYGNPEIIAINQVRCEFRSWIPLMCAHARTHARTERNLVQPP
jgi:alpha-galactosidase